MTSASWDARLMPRHLRPSRSGGTYTHVVPRWSTKGKLRFAAYQGSLNASVFIDFCRRLLADTPGPVFLVLDGHPVRRSNAVKEFAASTGGRLRLFFSTWLLAGAEPGRVGVEARQA
jgi:hypothetical protein